MKQLKAIYFLLGLLALCVGHALADVNVTLYFPTTDFSLSQKVGKGIAYDFVSLKGCTYTASPGEPMLPVKTLYLSIPVGEEPSEVIANITSTQGYTISKKIYPAQYPVAANGVVKDIAFAEPNGVYSTSANYPGTSANAVHSGYLGGYRIAAVNVFPVQYNPATKKISLATSINLTLRTRPSSVQPVQNNRRTAFQDNIYQSMVKALVTNSAGLPMVKSKSQSTNIIKPLKLTQLPSQESNEVPYIIITETPFDTVFQRLADWKTKRGLPTVVKKVSWINQNYFGVDLQDKIRNFIRDCYSNWGTVYVLLGGGPEIVPCRYTRNFCRGYAAASALLYTENVPSDMYYSDLDGTWNTEGDNYFGEGPVKNNC